MEFVLFVISQATLQAVATEIKVNVFRLWPNQDELLFMKE
jgi:hypothetical protein